MCVHVSICVYIYIYAYSFPDWLLLFVHIEVLAKETQGTTRPPPRLLVPTCPNIPKDRPEFFAVARLEVLVALCEFLGPRSPPRGSRWVEPDTRAGLREPGLGLRRVSRLNLKG